MAAPGSGDLYAELKGWQQAIGSVLGFLALMAAALWNFSLNRRRDRLLRQEEAASVAAALYGEILLLRREIANLARLVAGMARQWGPNLLKVDAHFLEAHPLPEPMLYKALAPKLGLLSPDLLLAITAFHRDYQDVCVSLPLLVENPERKYGYGEAWVLRPARSAVQNVVPALRKIERMLSIAKPADEPDLGHTDDIIEMEDLAAAEG